MRRVDSFSPGHSLGLGFLLGGLSPKLLLLTGAAVVTLVTAGYDRLLRLLGLILYVLIASLPILIPVALVILQRDRASARLAAWKAWLIDHQSRVLGAGSILLGLLLVVSALESAAVLA